MEPVVILGLGVSGLGCAVELTRRKLPFIAFEKEDRAGGLAKTEGACGFWFDHSPHILQKIPAELEELFRDLEGLDLAICSGRSGIALDTRLECVVPAPFQRHLSHLPLQTRARLLFEILRDKCRGATQPANYAEYATARCGRGVYDLFLRGYDAKRLRFPLEQIPADWTSRLERTSLASLIKSRGTGTESEAGHRESRFFYPLSGGIETLPKAMARLLPENTTLYGREAVEIRPDAKLVAFANGESVRYEHLVSSLALPETVALIRDAPPEVRSAAQDFLFTSIYILNAGIHGPVPPWTLLRIPNGEVGFYRVSFPSQYAAGCVPEGHEMVVGEISHHPTRYPLSSCEARQQFRDGLERLGILQKGQKTVFESIRNIRYGHVLYNHATRASIRLVLEYLRARSIFPCGKYGLWKDMLIPQSILTGIEAAREITARS